LGFIVVVVVGIVIIDGVESGEVADVVETKNGLVFVVAPIGRYVELVVAVPLLLFVFV
jgi:hypothetical protein